MQDVPRYAQRDWHYDRQQNVLAGVDLQKYFISVSLSSLAQNGLAGAHLISVFENLKLESWSMDGEARVDPDVPSNWSNWETCVGSD